MDIVDIIKNSFVDIIGKEMPAHPGVVAGVIFLCILATIVLILIYILLAWLCMRISRKIFRSIEKKQGRKIHLQMLESLVKMLIIIVFIVVPLAGDKIRQSVLGSAAVLTAVIGFAAQDVIKDMLSGLLISLNKPFDLGDRIELEDGTAGIVESITMRHVVLVLMDTVRLVIPNSKLNNATVKNLSYGDVSRSAVFSFPIHYDSDIEKARKTIADAVKGSPYSIPGKKDKSGESIYAPVYFIDIADSALVMKTTVYFGPGTPTEVLKDDINTRVFEALANAGVEIPYPHTSVIMEQGGV